MEAMSTLTLNTYQPLEQWRKIRSDLIEILDTDEAIKQEFFILSKSKLRRKVKVSDIDCLNFYF